MRKRYRLLGCRVLVGLLCIGVVLLMSGCWGAEAVDADIEGEGEIEEEPVDPRELKVIEFEDEALKAAIEEQLGAIYDLTQKDMEELTELKVWSSGVRYLGGLEYAINLESLDLYNNNIIDITEVSRLERLKYLNLSANNIKDISAISKLEKLERLDLYKNNIVDISALGGLKNLKEVDLQFNNIQDCSALANIKGLEVLKLQGNYIEDFKPLKELKGLRVLWVNGNSVKDYTQFEEFNGIEEFVYK